MTDFSTSFRRIALALALLAAFMGGILTERALAADDAIFWHDQSVRLAEQLAYYEN